MSSVAPAPSKASRPRSARNKVSPPPTSRGEVNTSNFQNKSSPASPKQQAQVLSVASNTPAAAGNATTSSMASGSSTGGPLESDITNDALLQSIASKQSALLQPTVTLTVYIPTASVGAVIGRRGQNIAALQKLASQHSAKNQPVRVSVIGNTSAQQQQNQGDTNQSTVNSVGSTSDTGSVAATSPSYSPQTSQLTTYTKLDFSNPDWTPVVIRADARAALIAARKLEETVGGEQFVDEVVLDIPLSRSKHAAIVGKRGLVLANMSADTNVRIMVPNKELRHDIVQLEGTLSNVQTCFDRLLQVALKAKNDYFSQTITCQQVPSQAKLRTLSRKTDVTIKKKKLEGDMWQLTVSGTIPDQVQAVVTSLQKGEESNNATPVATTTPPTATSNASSSSSTNSNGKIGNEVGSGGGGTTAAAAATKQRGGISRRGFGRSNTRNDKPIRKGKSAESNAP